MPAQDILIDQDHHYLPIFYLKRWAESDKRVPYFQWLDGRILSSRITPKYTGLEPNLYAQESVPLEQKHLFETTFYKTIDTKASAVCAQFVNATPFRPSPDEKVWWSAFLLAAYLRIPSNIRKFKASGTATVIADLERDPEEFRDLLPNSNLREWVEQNLAGVIENFGLRTIAKFITDEKQIEFVASLHWSGHSFPNSTHELITGDCPLLLFGTPETNDFVMMMALSPHRLFVASQAKGFTHTIIDANHTDFVRTFNRRVIERAEERVYGRIEQSFVERVFRTKPMGVIQSR